MDKIWNLIGQGMRLRIDKKTGVGKIVEGLKRYNYNREDILITPLEQTELLQSGLLVKITENTECNRLGWKELGYDGYDADWYAFIQ